MVRRHLRNCHRKFSIKRQNKKKKMPTPMERRTSSQRSQFIDPQSASTSSSASVVAQQNDPNESFPLLFLNNMEPFEENPGINIGHITASHNGHVILLSGFKGYKENSTAFYRPSEEIWIYDQIVEKWIKKICTTETGNAEDMPLERSSACGTIIQDYLYMFGGFSEEGNLNTLYRLDLETLKWKKMKPNGQEPLPCDKNVCWEFDEKFYLFGGYGPVPRIWSEDFQFQFIFDTSSHWHYLRGWNNQLVCYDPQTNIWEWPQHHGQVPSARAACAASKIGDQVYLFGGRMNKERMNDMYCLDMRTMQWTQVQANDSNHPVRGRSWHSLTAVSPDHSPSLVLYGGFSHDNQPLKDCWLFDTRSGTWREVILPFERPRFWHSATLSPFGEILVLGGAIEELNGTFHRSAKYNHIFAKDMFALRFQPQSLFRLCLSAIATNIKLSERLFSILPKCVMEIVFRRCITANNHYHRQMIDKIHNKRNQNQDHQNDNEDDGDSDEESDVSMANDQENKSRQDNEESDTETDSFSEYGNEQMNFDLQ